jgi:hypothetical protein
MHTGTWVSVESLTSALQEEIDIVDAALSGLKGRLLVVFYEVENAAIACASTPFSWNVSRETNVRMI